MANEIAAVILARRYEAKMADADKMRNAALLASGVAHNFNNLLQAVMGQASLIEMQAGNNKPVLESSRVIVEAAAKGAELVKQLLGFSLQGTPTKQPLSLERILLDSRELYQSLLGEGVQLEFEFDENLPMVLGDQGQLQQVATNLLMNARDALKNKHEGLVRIRMEKMRLRSGEIDPELAPGWYLCLEIRDNGVGMDAERQTRCFEPFFTTKDVDVRTGLGLGGTGLGLSSAYSIVRRHAGVITVSSSVGEGTTFSIFLPVAPESSHALEEPSKKALESVPVIFADVEDTVVSSLKSILDSLGVRSRVESNRRRVLDLAADHDADLRVVLLDLDRIAEGSIGFIDQLLMRRATLRLIASTVDRALWEQRLSAYRNVLVVEKPVGVWAIHSVVKDLFPGRMSLPLQSKIEKERKEEAQETSPIVGSKKRAKRNNEEEKQIH
jgi:nitrogen-specific signal transduction histidine kinase